ncbi:portal protein [Sphingobium yanoikuyae]|jgi:HK97 family phage portal protein|uniref:Portal protein n=1 Tax=Sphingobium yanoikuyae TaxID=13690 RepID=A0A177JKX2_SPHYA|nr:phage portal protein [Sphingobium yanoikuyae]OAH41979.1 portal protein [Sphingobium yanoikuyae]PZU67820.1 MAG: phage portal protein [Sphingobium sp.]
MKWFGTKAAALEAGRPVLARAWGSGAVALGEWPASYEAQLRAGVIGNPVAQRAMRLVSEGAGACALKVGAADGAAAARIGALVARASAGQGLIETLASHVLLHGNGYVQVIAGADGMPAELFALRPERVSVEADARGWPAAYLYRVGESVTRLSPEDGAGRTSLLHIRALHPLDDHYGLGCVGAAAGAVAIHNAATVWNKALLDNAARPSGAMVYAPGDGSVLSPEQFERVRREMEAAFSGAANAGRPMLLEGGLDWRAMSLSPAEMDFVGLKAAAAREIALAFGVPPMLMGLPGDNSYANYREANKALWRQTILPLVGKIGAGLAQGLQGWWPGLSLVPDLDAVPALSDERAALWERVAGADFLTAEEKKGLLGIG